MVTFNQTMVAWNTSAVIDMRVMYYEACDFNLKAMKAMKAGSVTSQSAAYAAVAEKVQD